MDKQLKKQFDDLRRVYGESIFRCAVTHMIQVGGNHFTPEIVQNGIAQMQQEEDERLRKKSGGVPIMTAGFKIDIVECAAKLAEYDTWDLLRYIKKFVEIG